MEFFSIAERIKGRYRKNFVSLFFKRRLRLANNKPYISFTFDDFPASALYTGGAILKKYGAAGTYYASLGLVGTRQPSGQMFALDDLETLFAQDHELGCHTYHHCNAFNSSLRVFEQSIIQNKKALKEIAPDKEFETFSFPIAGPNLRNKFIIGRYFNCCRGGGQTFNLGEVDLTLLRSYFIEMSVKRLDPVKALIDKSNAVNGWLIFATHDVAERHTRYGCKPAYFEAIVKYGRDSGASILPVNKALKSIRQTNQEDLKTR